MLDEIFGGLAAMLVALPSAIAFGLVVYAPLGTTAAAQGALAGILGSIALGCVAPALGGAPRLISAPCAPAAAVLAAFVTQALSAKLGTELIVPLVLLVTILTGATQVLFGTLGGGRLIKYIPYPVVAGYLSGVGVLIFTGQLPKFLGVPKELHLWDALTTPSAWSVPALVVGTVPVLVMILAPRLTRIVPAAILALLAGIAAYFAMGLVGHPELLSLDGNKLVIGSLQGAGGSDAGFFGDWLARWSALKAFPWDGLRIVVVSAATLAVLLSIDTLKTCVVLDALTRSRHDSNRELRGQGTANMVSGLLGGLAGAGTMGATLVNLASGGRTRVSGIAAGVFSAAAFIVFGKLVAWVPLPALAGILLVVGTRMVDRSTFKLLKNRSTVFDFLVILSVVLVAVTVSLITAAGVGLGLAILLFLREQIRGSVVRRRTLGSQMFSKKRRLPAETAVLESKGAGTVIFELQGSLFFGTTDQLLTELGKDLPKARIVILDLRRVRSIDYTAGHMLAQIEDQITERKGWLLFADLPPILPAAGGMRGYFEQIGLTRPKTNVKIFPCLDDALEWSEDQLLAENGLGPAGSQAPLGLAEIDLLSGISADSVSVLEKCVQKRVLEPGEKAFAQRDKSDELFLIRSGDIRILLPLDAARSYHVASFGRGDFFGEICFLDGGARSADAVACSRCELYALSRAEFDRMAKEHHRVEALVLGRLARALAIRLRLTDTELSAVEQA